jgi:hypothetical protein
VWSRQPTLPAALTRSQAGLPKEHGLDLDLLIRKLVRVRMRFPEIEEIRGTGLDLEKGARYLLIIRRD